MSVDAPATVATSKSERAYDWLHRRIVEQRYAPGFRLVLGTLADELGMSVVPIREAIRRLEAEGLVTYQHNVGAQVAFVDKREYACTMQTLGILEGAATAMAAPELSPADLDRALAINDALTALVDDLDPQTFTRLNERFHAVLFERCPNPRLLELVTRDWARLASIRDSSFAFIPERAAQSVAEHVEIVDLIRAGADPERIELTVRHHRWRTRDALLAAGQTTSGSEHRKRPR